MARSRPLLPASLTLVACTLAAVAAAPARAASVVTQLREPGTDLIAHRYDATATGTQKVTVVATPPHPQPGDDADWSSLTVLDLDRDNRADMLVSIVHTSSQGALADYKAYAVSPSASVPAIGQPSRTCLVLVPGTTIGAAMPAGASTTTLETRSSARAVSVSADFSAMAGIGGRARYGPKMATVWTPAAAALNGGSPLGDPLRIDSYLPAAARGGAGPGACHGTVGGQSAPGFLLDLGQATDRDIPSSGGPLVRQVMADRREGTGGEADLVEADIEQWSVMRATYDVTADGAPQSFAQVHPADLVLRFADAGSRSSASYLASLPGGHPDALVTTTGAPGAGLVDVQLETGLAGLSGNVCYPRDGSTRLPNNSVWGQGDTISLRLPVSHDADGNAVVRVALDRLLGLYRDATSNDVATFYWLATTLPTAGADPDYAPDYGGSGAGGSLQKCAFGGPGGQTSEGTWVDTGRMVTMSPTISTATLTATTVHPAPGQDVTLTAAGVPATGQDTYAFDITGSGGYGGVGTTATQTFQYRVPTRVAAVVRHPDGTYAQATLDIVPQNPPPTPSFKTDRTPPFRSASGGNAVLFTDTSTDNSLIASRHWTLRPDGGDPVSLDHPEDPTVGYTFPAYEDRHWTMTLTVTDDDLAASTTTQGFDVLPYDGPGAVFTTAVLRRVVPVGKVYAKRDVVFSAADSTSVAGAPHYAWDLDGDGTFETDTGLQATATTTYAGAGHRDVRVRVTDGRGRQVVSDPLGVDVGDATDLAPSAVLTAPDVVSLSGGSVAVALDASGSSGRNIDDLALRFAWDLNGDGTYETDTGATSTATAVLRSSGDHVVRVRVTDAYDNRATAEKTVFVRGAAEISHACQDREQFRVVTYGPARASACWSQVSRPSAGPLWIARGDFALNGLAFRKGTRGTAKDRTFADCASGGACAAAQSQFNDERQGARVALDPSDGTLISNGPVAVDAQGSDVNLRLNDGPLDLTLPATTAKTEDGIIFHPPGGANLLFLKVADEAEVRFPEAGTATIALSAQLPPQMPGAGGDVTLRATETQGIILDHLKIEVQTGVLSEYLKLANLSIEYDRADQQWTGAASLGLPGIKGKEFAIDVELVIANGRFKSIYGAIDGLEIELGPGILLQRIRAGVGVDPLDLQGGMGISAGPKIAGHELLSADGDLRVTFPSADAPFVLFQVAGNTQLLGEIELTRGVLRFATNGFFEARGGISRSVGIGYFNADIGGWFTFDKVNLTGNAEVGLQLLGRKVPLAAAHAVLSTKGIAACGELPVINVGAGIGYRWNGEYTTFRGCDLGPYSEDRPAGLPDGFTVRSAATRAPSVTLPAGLRSANVAVHGRGGPPKVKLVDAKGATVVDATAEQLTPKAMVLMDPNTSVTQILVKHPPKGRYIVVPAEGSTAITKVEHAVDAGPQRVRATVTGTGPRRVLHWTVTPGLARGQQLTLGEAMALDGSGQAILTTTHSTGSRPFAPQEGHGERRVITATVLTDGLGRPSTVAARFSAPRTARPAKPNAVALRRRGRAVDVSWTAPAGPAPAGGWRVTVNAGTLRQVDTVLKGTKTTYVLTDVPAQLAVTARIAGIGAGRAQGTPATATLAAGAQRSGAGGAADARPRALTARRAAGKLVVRWHGGPEKVRRFAVRVRIGTGRTVLLHATAAKPTVAVARLPKARTAIHVEVRAERFGGPLSAAAVLTGSR